MKKIAVIFSIFLLSASVIFAGEFRRIVEVITLAAESVESLCKVILPVVSDEVEPS